MYYIDRNRLDFYNQYKNSDKAKAEKFAGSKWKTLDSKQQDIWGKLCAVALIILLIGLITAAIVHNFAFTSSGLPNVSLANKITWGTLGLFGTTVLANGLFLSVLQLKKWQALSEPISQQEIQTYEGTNVDPVSNENL